MIIKLSTQARLSDLYEKIIQYEKEGEKIIIGGKAVKSGISKYQFGEFIIRYLDEVKDLIPFEQFEDYYLQAKELMK